MHESVRRVGWTGGRLGALAHENKQQQKMVTYVP